MQPRLRIRSAAAALFLAASVSGQNPLSKPDEPVGAIQVTVNSLKMAYHAMIHPNVVLFDRSGNHVFQAMWEISLGVPFVIPNLPTGDYKLAASVWFEDCLCSAASSVQPCHDPYIAECYNNAPDTTHADWIHVNAPETVTGIVVDIESAYYRLVQTSPAPFRLYMDLCHRLSPQYYAWAEGETHPMSVQAEEPGPLGGTYFFDHWSQGGSREQNYTVPYGVPKETLTAFYVLKYRFDPLSDHGRPWGAGWYEIGSAVPFGVESPVIEYTTLIDTTGLVPDTVLADSVLFRFRWWQGTGLGHYTGGLNPATVTLQGGISETALWDRMVPLTVQVADTAMGAVIIDPPGNWQPEDSTVFLRAIPKQGFRFTEWNGAHFGTSDTVSLVMDTSKSLIAHFQPDLHPPILAVPDTSFAEDDTLFLFASLIEGWISDPVDPALSLTVGIGEWSPHLYADMTSWGLGVWADPDWNGEAWIVLTVTDPLGSSDSDTVRVTVLPVNDPPGPFSLLEPGDGTVVPDMMIPVFRWSSSANADAINSDSIRYVLVMGPETGDPDSVGTTPDTTWSGTFLETGSYRWTAKAVDLAGNVRWATPEGGFRVGSLQDVPDHPAVPMRFDLSRNFPNPFNPGTTVVYSVPKPERVTIEIVAMSGSRVRTLVDRTVQPGEYTIVWDGKDDEGRKAGSGVFLCRMKAGHFVKTVKMTILR